MKRMNVQTMKKTIQRFFITVLLASFCLSACAKSPTETASSAVSQATSSETSAEEQKEEPAEEPKEAPAEEPKEEPSEEQAEEPQEEPAEKTGEVYVLFTSDVHCGIDQGFGYTGLAQIRKTLEQQGHETILVDDGDSVQGEAIGMMTRGEAIIDLMNELDYDLAIPGNHEFDYGMEQFFALVNKAEYPYLSCNITKEGKLILAPYMILDAADKRIAFVGVTTPTTPTESTPAIYQDENGNVIYEFMQDQTGGKLYNAVQTAVDDARAEGADLVYLIAHLGMQATASPWTYADVVANTSGIDVVLDGHSHDTEHVVMKNKNGEEVVRQGVGTKLEGIGYSHINADGTIAETGLWAWENNVAAPELLQIDNEMSKHVDDAKRELEKELGVTVGTSTADLTINDPIEKTGEGKPVRMVRRAETNLGDFVADAYKEMCEAEIGLVNGGSIRVDLPKGNITYGDLISVIPFGDEMCVIEATGQQILDALEWGANMVPDEEGHFLQVSGLQFEIHSEIASPCVSDEDGLLVEISGERRIRNVLVNGEELDPARTYTVAGSIYTLKEHGGGYTCFDESEILKRGEFVDYEVLMRFVESLPNQTIGETYADPYGQGRITVTE